MKAMKAFIRTCYSEELLSSGGATEVEQDKSAANATEGGPADEKARDAAAPTRTMLGSLACPKHVGSRRG